MAGAPALKPKLKHIAELDAALAAVLKPKTAAELALQYVEQAFERLIGLAQHAEQESVRLGAIREILDRAYGKPVQAVAGQFDGKLTISWALPGDEGVTIDLPSKQLNE